MKTEICAFGGWSKNLLLGNSCAELVVSLEVGPRILSYKLKDRDNILKNFEDQMGGTGEKEWKIRGGHRLWTAPENMDSTYHIDNSPVEHEEKPGGEVIFSSTQTTPFRLWKEIGVQLDAATSRVSISHTLRNDGSSPLKLAPWALTVMNPGGVEIIPQPPLGRHPEDLLPNRNLVVWPYTDLTDPRLHIGSKFITLQQASDMGPIKFGLSHRCGWVAYLWQDSLFIKEFSMEPDADYPDMGCNFETFTNEDMLEIESLGPQVLLAPGKTVSHREQWRLFPVDTPAELTSEDELAEWIRPSLEKSGIPFE